MSRHATGRRAAQPARRDSGGRRRPDLTVVLAVLLPAATLGAALLVDATATPAPDREPDRTELAAATLVCPGATDRAQAGIATTEARVAGEVRVGAEPLPLASGRVTTVAGDDPLVVAGEGPTAPGLVATRSDTGPLAAAGCTPPLADGWFTGVGSAAGFESVLELVNPDAGPAVVDVTVHSPRGEVPAPELRGITVPGGSTITVPLAERVPRRGELALHVATTRGRAAAAVRNTYDELGGGLRATEWLAAQAEPATESLLVGLPEGDGERLLVLANPGADEARVRVRLVTDESSFVPEGLTEVRVPPSGVAAVPVTEEIAAAGDVLAVRLEASAAVAATLRSVVAGDLAHTVAGGRFRQPLAVVTPEGAKRLVLAGADSTGAVAWVARSAAGERLGRGRVEVVAERGLSLPLPAGARLVEVAPEGASVVGSVVLGDATGSGGAVLRLRAPLRGQLVADVRPGLP